MILFYYSILSMIISGTVYVLYVMLKVSVGNWILLCVFYSYTNNSPQIFKINKSEQERSNCQIIFSRQVYFMMIFSNLVAYVFLIMLKWCNIHEFHVLIHFVASAMRGTRPTLSSDWLLFLSRLIIALCLL